MTHRIRKWHQQTTDGFSLVELMVGLTVGMLVLLIISQVFAVSEGQKLTVTSTTDSVESGAVGLYYMERELRMAGYGLSNSAYFGCQVEANDSTRTGTFPNIAFPLVPVQITQGANGAPDSVFLVYGNSDGFGTGATFSPSGAGTFSVLNRAGFYTGDLVIAVGGGTDGNLAGPPASGNVCELVEATSLPTAAGQTDFLYFNQSSYVNMAGTTVTPTHNPGAGLGVSFSNTGTLLDLGQAPRGVTYSIAVSADGNHYTLQSADIFSNQTAAVVDDVINLQAQYGLDNGISNPSDATMAHTTYVANDGVVDEYIDSLPANPTPAQWAQVLSVRVALLARSKVMEKKNAAGNCTTTTSVPSWSGGTFSTVTSIADWGCYHYRVFETIVPLRNMIWKH
jgi:type IV pilus assembly protein PilW